MIKKIKDQTPKIPLNDLRKTTQKIGRRKGKTRTERKGKENTKLREKALQITQQIKTRFKRTKM